MRNLIKNRFVKFVCVGIINTLFGYGCFSFLLYIGLHYTLAVLLSTILGVLFNFKSTGILVFRSYDNGRIFRFIACYAMIYLLNIVGMEMLLQSEFTPYVAGAILIVPMAILSFILQKRLVFNHD